MRTIWRVLRTELLRGTAPVAAVALAVAGVALLLATSSSWAGRWVPLAENARLVMVVLGPLVTTAGAWQAGRERRRRIVDLVGATSRPPWQRIVVVWAAVTIGACAGFLVAWLVGAATVAPLATYAGRGWWLTLVGGFVGLGAMSAFGVVAGWLVPLRVTAPLAGVAAAVICGWAGFVDGSARWLVPNFRASSSGTSDLESGFQLLQLVWLGAVTVTLLMLTARRVWLSLIPVAVAAVAAVPILMGPGDGHWQEDPAALEMVCSDDAGPRICLTRVDAFLLDEATTMLRARLARWQEVSAGFDPPAEPVSVVHASAGAAPPENGLSIAPMANFVMWNGTLSEGYGSAWGVDDVLASALTELTCGPVALADTDTVAWNAATYANEWARLSLRDSPWEIYPFSETMTLLGLTETEQGVWMGRYLEAARTCDQDALVDLTEELA